MPYETALALARRGLGGGALAASGIRYAPAGSIAISTLRAGDALAEGIEEAERWIEAGRHEGFIVGLPMAHATAAAIRQVAGDLPGAEADARIGLRLAEGTPPGHATRIWSTAELLGTLVLQGKLDEADLLAPLGEAAVFSSFHARLYRARAQLHLLRGRLGAALADIEAVGRWCDARGITGPHGEVPWRGIAGAVLRRQGDEDEARQLATDDLDVARRFGAPGALGAALHAQGLVTTGDEGTELLRAATEVLAGSDSRLALAAALLDHGAALRRGKHATDAREPLRQALDLAHRCGAHGLAEQALVELQASGARPRRSELSGVAALTASERRIADLAAGGCSNREIAQQLFLTRKTVESHLHSVYMKLDIEGRAGLPQLLSQ